MPAMLLSETVVERYGKRIEACASSNAGWHILRFQTDAVLSADLIADIKVAFLSSDILGGSTADRHEPAMQGFCELLWRADNLAWLQVPSSGVDRSIYQALARRGVVLTTAAGVAAETVALTALTGLLALSRRLPLWVQGKQTRTWLNLRSGPAEPRELRGEKILIVGCGNVGTRLAEMSKHLGLLTHGLRRQAVPAYAPFDEMGLMQDLSTAVQDADWVVAACPLTDTTRGIFDAELFARFQSHASFINVSRGGVVKQADLVDALQRGRIESAYLDVFELEPLPADSPLWDLPNVLISPHCAGDTRGRHARIAELFMTNLERWIHGQQMINQVQTT